MINFKIQHPFQTEIILFEKNVIFGVLLTVLYTYKDSRWSFRRA